MTEQSIKFDNFLYDIDKEYSSYFSPMRNDFETIRKCFAVHNFEHLIYRQSSKLRKDVFDKVVQEHKKIYGDKTILTFAD